jgi:hypothetical protein
MEGYEQLWWLQLRLLRDRNWGKVKYWTHRICPSQRSGIDLDEESIPLQLMSNQGQRRFKLTYLFNVA